MTNQLAFRLFACCIPVRGAQRSTICDLQRHSYYLIPNALFDILTCHRDKTVEQVKLLYHTDHSAVIDEYYYFLLEKNLGFWCTEPDSFPELRLSWETPRAITNAIIDVNESSAHSFNNIFKQLDQVGCEAVQIRFFCRWDIERLEHEVLIPAMFSRLRSMEILMRFNPAVETSLEVLLGRYKRITLFIIHDAPEDKSSAIQGVRVLHRKEFIDSDEHCGQVSPAYFSPTMESFSESQKFNTCLNKKVGIDVKGRVKNCPSCSHDFGNIDEVKIEEVAKLDEFKSIWHINKDSVEICQDCEFRYICTDCRVFISRQDNLYSKPAKCRYDPYSAQWT